MRVTYWWMRRKGDKKRPLDVEIVNALNVPIGGLVQSVEDGNAYEDLQSLGNYIQWILDEEQYQKSVAIHKEELRVR
ncbi:hypothetical protein KC19_VG289500 [Ceratodon purpureus]|uniref:Uncharacterized protein n=1 Tax=Ceratodon purpureus TaxID=3225 RepID=A0A8T0HVL7_CERPU|nr:hypothetical protein KC19_VG289500 [Ceratodon purpureus]